MRCKQVKDYEAARKQKQTETLLLAPKKNPYFSKKKYVQATVIFGAPGFTCALVVEYLRDRAPKDLRWAVAGRAKAKLEAVLRDLGVTVPVLITECGDDTSLFSSQFARTLTSCW